MAQPNISAVDAQDGAVTPEIRVALAPRGRLRAAINYGNPILAARHPASGAPTGVSVDLATRLAALTGLALEWVPYDAAGKVVDGLARDEWDVAFVARDPVRGKGIAQTLPYVVIEGAYLVREDSPIRANEQVDRKGIRVVVGQGSAYDLFLTRTLENAAITRAATSQAVVATLLSGNDDVAAGVRQQLESDAARVPGLRLLDGRFMVIEQAMGTPLGRPLAFDYVSRFLRAMLDSGFVQRALEAHGINGATVVSPAPAREQTA
ncbi:MAG: ABC transporter substrate-binding protein [Janthinobacterium lividum]